MSGCGDLPNLRVGSDAPVNSLAAITEERLQHQAEIEMIKASNKALGRDIARWQHRATIAEKQVQDQDRVILGLKRTIAELKSKGA